jgi:apolipoprotein N-acyltransferase
VRVAFRGGDEALVVELGGASVAVVAVVSAAVVVVSVLVVVVVSVLVVAVSVFVVDAVVSAVVVGALVVGSVVVGGSSARAPAAAPFPKMITVASVAISFWRAMGRDYRRLSNVLLHKRSAARVTRAATHTPAQPTDRRVVRRGSN